MLKLELDLSNPCKSKVFWNDLQVGRVRDITLNATMDSSSAKITFWDVSQMRMPDYGKMHKAMTDEMKSAGIEIAYEPQE